MNKILVRKIIPSLFSIAFLFSCGGDDDNPPPPPPQNGSPVIQAQSFTAAENVSATTVIGQIQATDPEDDDLTFTLTTDADDLFEVSADGELTLEAGKMLDFETKTSHTISVEVSDDNSDATATITVNVTDVDETTNSAPLFDAQTFSVQENVTGRGFLVATLVATDPDGDPITFSWDPNGTVTAFELSADTGRISTVNGPEGDLDFETTPQYVLSVIASDGMAQTQADITINVTDFNDKPEAVDQTFTVAEDINDANLIGQVAATDQDGDQLSFGIQSDPDDLFRIFATSGELFLKPGSLLDFETATQHTVEVSVTDGTETILVNITIDVTDVDDAISGTVSTIAGTGMAGTTGGASNVAQFNFPGIVAEDSQGNIYVADINQRRVRKIDVNGTVTTLDLLTANPIRPRGLAIDANDNLYISDFDQHYILKVTFDQSGTLTLQEFAGVSGSPGFSNGGGTNGLLKNPMGMAFDSQGNLIVADWGNSAIRKIDTNGNITTIAGNGTVGNLDGTGTAATFERPIDVAITSDGAIFVADVQSHSIRKIATNGTVTRFAGSDSGVQGYRDGVGTFVRFREPAAIVADGDDNLYIADAGNNTIRKLEPNQRVTGLTSDQAGNVDGDLNTALFNRPAGVGLVRGTNNLYVGGGNNHTIRKIEFN